MSSDERKLRHIEIPPAELGHTATPIQRDYVPKAIKAIVPRPKSGKPSIKLKKKDDRKKSE